GGLRGVFQGRLLKRHYWEMRADDLDLFINKPTGRMSWAGHQQQFRGWQANLRAYLEQADLINCKAYPSDAWYWATRAPPSAPGPK
ncbi:hypothetical protein, partial [Xanthomonas oryzae]|uniref:hypothetical protein n=1 Tax=Xanthomonas oryzae TaxID=347 RepID=UPI001ED9A28C